jgi:mono/diheme cytochrome c family protein
MRISAIGLGLIGLLGAGLWCQGASAQAVSYTGPQALRGLQAFNENCMRCHGPAARGGEGPPLSGARFDEKWRGKPAKALWDHMSNNMPYDNPGTLGKDTYVSILAYVLQLNGVGAGQQPLVEDPPGVIPGR